MNTQFFESAPAKRQTDRKNSDKILWVQRNLNRALGIRLVEDGIFGEKTRQAVREFQRRKGLVDDGIPGKLTQQALASLGAGILPSVVPGKSGLGSLPAGPSLIRKESSSQGLTLYLNIDLKIRDKNGRSAAKPMTGVFIPQKFTPGKSANLIIYLHGFKHPDLMIDQYWAASRPRSFPLRERTDAQGKNLILVAPTLGYHSQSGLLTRGGFDAFVDAVLAGLAAYAPFKDFRPQAGNIILACHSGGGLPMRLIANSKARYAANICELWGFDCTYNRGDDRAYAGWAQAASNRRVYIYYLSNTRTANLSLSLDRLKVPNVTVSPSPAGGHNAVPLYHWSERINGAACLRNGFPSNATSQEYELFPWPYSERKGVL